MTNIFEFNQNNKIMIVDVESDGLYGESFAIGAVILNCEGEILDKFIGVCLDEEIKNQWVIDNVLPKLIDDTNLTRYETRRDLRKAFYKWYIIIKDLCSIWVDFGAPVETNMFRLMIEENGKDTDGPYPLHEIDTYLFAKGYKSDTHRYSLAFELIPDRLIGEDLEHNPLYDAYISGLALIKADRGSD